MPPSPARHTASVHVNGYTLRVIRQLLDVRLNALAAEIECSRSYLNKLELGHSRTCSPAFLTRLAAGLGHIDRKALMVCAHEVLLIEGRARAEVGSGVHVNGIALRTIRVLGGQADRTAFGQVVGLSKDQLAVIEATQAALCSPQLVARCSVALGLREREALLACPYGEQPHAQRWNPDSDSATAPFPRPKPETLVAPSGDAGAKHRAVTG